MIVYFLLAVVAGIVLTIARGHRGDRPVGVVERRPDSAGSGASGLDLWRLLVQLARVEARRLLRHPVFLASAALSIYALVFTGVRHSDPLVLTGQGLIPIAGGTFLAANLAGVRDRRSGTEELYASLPALPSAWTLAHLLSVVAAVVVGVLVLGISDTLIRIIGGPIAGWTPSPIDLLQGPLAIASAGALGILFARWIATPMGALLGPLIVGVILLGSPIRPVAIPFIPIAPGAKAGWHVLFIVSFVVLAASAALLRHLRRIPLELLACGALAGAIATGILQAGSMQ